MRALLVFCLLVPLSASRESLKCVNNCFAEPIMSMLTREVGSRRVEDSTEFDRPAKDPLQNACSQADSVVKCLERCEPGEQREYFRDWTAYWRGVGCNGTQREIQERMRLTAKRLQCFDGQEEALLTKVATAILAKGGSAILDEGGNLCEIAGAVAKAVSNTARCEHDAKTLAMDFIEQAYRWVLLKLGIREASPECRSFHHFAHETISLTELMMGSVVEDSDKDIKEKDQSTVCMQQCVNRQVIDIMVNAKKQDPCTLIEPVVACIKQCPANKLQEVAKKTHNLLCKRSAQRVLYECFDREDFDVYTHGRMSEERMRMELDAFRGLFTSGANSSASVAENVCDIYTSITEPGLGPLKQFIESTKDAEAKAACNKALDAITSVTSLPLRLVALKLGISQDDIRCD